MFLAIFCIVYGNVIALAESDSATAISPLTRAHAHNDYYHTRPLLDALEHGFCSVEADVFLVDGELLVGHSRWELKPGRTLQSLYLGPLFERVKRNRGWVLAEEVPFTLLVDIKADGAATYHTLREVLKQYRTMLSGVTDGKFHRRAVELVLSGDRPRELVASQTERYVFLDGRLGELSAETNPHLVPLVSANWNRHFLWRGYGKMPVREQEKLQRILKMTQTRGCRLRFWGTPERPTFWQKLADEGVDLIGTDDLEAFKAFWDQQAEPTLGRARD